MPTATALPQRHVENCMGTVFSIDVRAPGVAARAVREVVAWLHWVDATFSTYRPGSEMSRLRRGELALGECAPEVGEVLARCAELADETDGYFDCRYTGAPEPTGYVKGWAIERASDLLEAAGSVNHCINGGGDVQCVGGAGPDAQWRIGVTDPGHAGRLLGVATGNRLAVATSGTAERGAHLVDPHTGERPAAFTSITVIGDRLADVDAFATAAFAMGERAEQWLRSRGATAILLAAGASLPRYVSP